MSAQKLVWPMSAAVAVLLAPAARDWFGRQGYSTDLTKNAHEGQLMATGASQPLGALVEAYAKLHRARVHVAKMERALFQAKADVTAARAAVDVARGDVGRAMTAALDAREKLRRHLVLYRSGLASEEAHGLVTAVHERAVMALDATQSRLDAAETKLRSAEISHTAAVSHLAQARREVRQMAGALDAANLGLLNALYDHQPST